jgi:hypothetical protein
MKTNTVPPREASPAFTTSIEGTWFVKTGAGIQSLTLDELDEKFQRGEVSARTPVFTSGMTAWDTLGAIADLEDAATSVPAAVPSARIVEDLAEALPEPSDGGSFPPMVAGVFGSDGPPWASSAPEKEGHTLVRRSTGVVPFSVRKAAAALADSFAELRLTHPRLRATGPWLFGAALSGIFIFSLYQLGAAGTRPGARTKSGWITARTTADEAPSAATAIPLGVSPAPASPAPSRAASILDRSELAKAAVAPRKDDIEPGDIEPGQIEPGGSAVLRTADLRLAAPTRSAAQLSRSARAKAKSAKAWSARKAKARASRQAAKRASKQRRAASLY